MGLSTEFANDLVKLVFQNADIANVGDAGGLRGSVAAGSLWLSLHTADPSGGTATTSETAYAGYARQELARGVVDWTVAGAVVSPAADIDFAPCTADPGSPITHVGIVTSASGAGKLLISGSLSSSISMAITSQPRIKSTTTITFS
jgi:hypothetical protein